MLLSRIQFEFGLLNHSYSFQLILIYIMSHWCLHSPHVTIVFRDCPLFFMCILFEKRIDQSLRFMLLFSKWQHLIHYIRYDVSILIFPFDVEKKLWRGFSFFCFGLLNLKLVFLIFSILVAEIHLLRNLRGFLVVSGFFVLGMVCWRLFLHGLNIHWG